ncbi:MAG: acyl-CoA dehydrogenase family protein [Pseudomonadota bacterium]
MHDTANQSPDYSGHNVYTSDPVLELLTVSLQDPVKDNLKKIGSWAGNADVQKLAALANDHIPVLNTHDARGNRIDQVEFHPAYHALMRKSTENRLHNSVWAEDDKEKGVRHLARAARFFMVSGVEMGHLCPITMTNAATASLKFNPALLNEWLPKILSNKYDSSHKPFSQKQGVTIGMGLTEREGGSDVRANKSTAEELGNGIWKINGQKWFMSAPMCDAFLVLAQTKDGLGCFFLPRILDDGAENGLRFQRLKEKLGNKSNASSEVEFHDSLGFLLGEAGRGIQTIIEMVSLTRLDCIVGSAGLMRSSLAEAVHHCRHRSAFGKLLVDQPIMERVLADLALDVTAATALSFRLASAFDRAGANPAEAAYARLMTPVIKYWVCKLAPALINECMECLGGNGYVETGRLARHYREAPLNAIWEGSGNIMCLDVIRVLNKDPDAVEMVLKTLEDDLGGGNVGKTVDVIRSAMAMCNTDPGGTRILVEQLALTAAAAELHRMGVSDIATAFTESRLGGLWRNTYGMLDTRHNAKALIERLFTA